MVDECHSPPSSLAVSAARCLGTFNWGHQNKLFLCCCAQSNGKERSEWKQTLMLAIPTAFDLVATVLMNVGLLSVTASVYQMMRGAEMLFAALFAVVFLRRTLKPLPPAWHPLLRGALSRQRF